MKYTVVMLLAVGLVKGSVLPAIRLETADRYHTQDEIGQYSYGYVDGPSTKTEVKTADGITRGGYSYIDPNGIVQSTSYIADPVHGFRVAATNLPVGPAVTAYAHAPALMAAHAPALMTAHAPAFMAAHAPVVTSHVVAAAPTYLTGTAFTAAAIPAISTIAAPIPGVDVQEGPAPAPAPEEAAPTPEDPAPVPEEPVPEIPEPVPETPEPVPEIPAPAPAPVQAESDDTVAVDAAVKSGPEEMPVGPEEMPGLPGPIPEPVQDTPEVAQARLAHLAAFEDAKTRNALIESANRFVSKTFVPAVHGGVLSHGPAIISSSRTMIAAAPAVVAHAAPAVVAHAAPAVVAHAAPTLVAHAHPGLVAHAHPGLVAHAHPGLVAHAHPGLVAHAAPAVIAAGPVASQYHSQDELGQYSFGYAGGPSTKQEVKTWDGVTRGGYSYLDANGLYQSASYVSDPVNGFRVAATNLPVQPVPTYLADTPEVQAAKENHFRLQAEHIAKL